MSTSEIKTEIHKVLDNVPENVLQSVLDYLKSIIHTNSDSVQLTNNLRQILLEDKELLQKLAE
ncbi:MAG TPA: hypothetical protein PLI68_05610 [Bacteroidia bacterium]|nr:hypothetical protein [Bacteroidia bacterium]